MNKIVHILNLMTNRLPAENSIVETVHFSRTYSRLIKILRQDLRYKDWKPSETDRTDLLEQKNFDRIAS